MEVELRLRKQHAMRELSARANSLAALEKRLDLSTPVRICLHCRLECNTVLRLLRRHGHHDCSTAYHAGYTFWAEWMDTALREVAGHFGLTSLTDFLTLMCQQQWFPAKEVDTPTPAADLHMRAWATYTGREIPERYHLSPPNDVWHVWSAGPLCDSGSCRSPVPFRRS